jgi:hypothetical protein
MIKLKDLKLFILLLAHSYQESFGGVPLNTEQNASQISYGRSVIWETASTATPFGTATAFFTTYNGGSGLPLYDVVGNRISVSQELTPNANISGQYRNDFLLYLGSDLSTYGTSISTFPTIDSDSNGVPDVVQFDRGIDATISGNAIRRWPNSLTEPFVGRVTRAANSTTGTYLATFTDGQRLSYSGTYRVLVTRGTVRYRRNSPTSSLAFNLQVNGAYRNIQLTGNASYSVSDRNTVVISQANLSGSDGLSYTTRTTTLRRSGNRYVGEMEMEDGEPITSWRDYVAWRFEIADPNDFDSDGIPDFSDDLIFPPSISAGPTSISVAQNQPFSLSVSANGSAPLRYRWQLNGTNLPGATNATLTRSSATSSDAGEYYVFVSNAAGTIRGGPAIVAVQTNTARLDVLAGPILNTNNGISYLLLSPGTWPTAAAAARQLGGNLATIPDIETQNWIVDRFGNFGGINRDLWIGLSDFRLEGNFSWESDSMSSYRNWQPGEPNNCCGGENFVGVVRSTMRWNDFGPNFQLLGVVEVAPAIPVHPPLRWPSTIRTNRIAHYLSLNPNLQKPSPLWISNSVSILSDFIDHQTVPVTVGGLPGRRAIGPYMNFSDRDFREWSNDSEIDILMLVFGDNAVLGPSGSPRDFAFLIGTLPDLDVQIGGSLPANVANSNWNWIFFRIRNTTRNIDGARRVGSLASNSTGNNIYGGVNGGTFRLQSVINLTVSAVAFGEKGAFGEPYQFTRFLPRGPRISGEPASGGRIRLSWPAEQPSLSLQTSTSVGAFANWRPVTQSPTQLAGTNFIIFAPTNNAFYRLKAQ